MQAVTSVGFPIVACGAMAYYVKYVEDKHREEREKLNESHNVEMTKLSDTVNNNTLALTKLCEKMDTKTA
jgi:hypothetical protein